MNPKNIRNFCIIAHIDHGKSTLADRLLEITGTIPTREMRSQFLDQLDLERERGITIKMAPVRMIYRLTTDNQQQTTAKNHESSVVSRQSSNSEYILNLIDTPGHSDFSYEVSRALAAVQGAILLVDATQGIQAQTLANLKNARSAGLTIIGAINKIDLFKDEDAERLELLRKHVSNVLDIPEALIFFVSGKTGKGVEELLRAVITYVPAPQNEEGISRALIFDSFYDNHKGVVASVRLLGGEIKKEDGIRLISTHTNSKVKEVGYFTPRLMSSSTLLGGEIGYIATGIKDPNKIKIGDTLIVARGLSEEKISHLALPGYKEPKPVVFVSFYSEEGEDFEILRTGLEKLKLNDSALSIEPDQNEVLGRGFKVGFLGRLHFEIVSERLRREFGANTLNTFPSVLYKVKTKKGLIEIVKPEDLPNEYEEIWEPMVRSEIIIPATHLKNLIPLQSVFRMHDFTTSTLASITPGFADEQIKVTTTMPLAELISDFDDRLKSATEGYASFSYEVIGYEASDVRKVDILIAGKPISGLSRFFPVATFEREARKAVLRLKDLLPKQQFVQALQAVSGGKIIAREDISALRKDVTGYLYGGDRTRKMKLWKKQSRGKKRLKERADVKISADIFKELLRR